MGAPPPDALKPLLAEIGGSYVPFLLANAAARAAEAEWIECAVQGGRWKQKTFAYLVKCLNAPRAGSRLKPRLRVGAGA